MEFLLIAFAPILIAASSAFIILYFSKSTTVNNDVFLKQPSKDTKSVSYHDSSKVADCMEGVKKTLNKHGITVNCANFVQKY